jgi:SNF2 family DNA or RNA helicase
MEQLSLRNYQSKGVEWLINKKHAGIVFDKGWGKTLTILTAFATLKHLGRANKMLVITPLKVAQLEWEEELSNWDIFADLRIVVLHGPNKDKLIEEDADIYVLNYEGIHWFYNRTVPDCQVLCLDEIHKVKNGNTQRVKLLKQVMAYYEYRWGMTATTGHDYDLFNQIYLLDGGKTFGSKITKWKERYFTFRQYSTPILTFYKDEFYEKAASVLFRPAPEDTIEIPQEVHIPIKLELKRGLKDLYELLERDFILDLGEDKLVAETQIAKTMKLRQLLGGKLYMDDGEVVEVHTEKYDALAALLEEIDGPVLVSYAFTFEREELLKRYPGAVHLDSKVSTEKARQIKQDWNDKKIRMLIGHCASIGEGLNLQKGGNYIIFFSLQTSYIAHNQFIGRLARPGGSEKVFIYYIVYKDTVEYDVVYNTLARRGTMQENLLKYIQRKH